MSENQRRATWDELARRVGELETQLAEYKSGATIYLTTMSTAPGYPAGVFPDPDDIPKATVHCLGAPEEVAAIKGVVAERDEALARVEAARAIAYDWSMAGGRSADMADVLRIALGAAVPPETP